MTYVTPDGKTRYYLADEAGTLMPESLDYLKFRDNQGTVRNTLRLNCYQLENYYTYLQEAGKNYRMVTIDDISELMAWIRNSDILKKVISIRFEVALGNL